MSLVAIGLALVGTGVFRGKAEAEPKQVRGVLVTLGKAEQRTLTLTARHRGELDTEVAELSAQATGRLAGVDVDIGDDVKQGQVLARVDASQSQRQISEAQAQVKSAEASKRRAAASLAGARLELERGKRLHQEKLMSQQEYDALESRLNVLAAEEDAADAQGGQARARVSLLQQQAKETKIVAPFHGAVAERFLDPGSLVQPGVKVLRVVKSGPLRVRFRVPERDLGRITRGMPVQVDRKSVV